MSEDPDEGLAALDPIELRIVANDLREALYALVYGDPFGGTADRAAEALLIKLPTCAHCGQMAVGHDALHQFTAKP